MSSLTGNLISSTYPSLLKITTNNTASANLNNITDGVGNATALSLSAATASIAGNLVVTGTLNATASNAVSSSYASTALTASFALVASTAPAYLLTSSFNASTGSYLRTGSNTFVGNQIITGSIIPGGSTYDLGSAAAPWQELYVSTGSIKFVQNGAVVSTLGAGTSGTQMTGSLDISSSISLSSTYGGETLRGFIKETGGNLAIYASSSGYQGAVTLQYDGANALNAEVLVNCNTGLSNPNYPAALVVSGKSDGTYGGMIALSRGFGGQAEWAFANDNNRNLLIGNYNQFFNKSIRFNYSASADNIIFSGSAILPGTANYYNLGSNTMTWNNTYTNNLNLKAQNQPTSPTPGQIYFNTNDNHFYGWNGTTWKQLDN